MSNEKIVHQFFVYCLLLVYFTLCGCQENVVKILLTSNACDFVNDHGVYPSLDGDVGKYMQCGQTGTYWLVPCQPGTVFDAEAEACVQPHNTATENVSDPTVVHVVEPTINQQLQQPTIQQPMVVEASTAPEASLAFSSNIGDILPHRISEVENIASQQHSHTTITSENNNNGYQFAGPQMPPSRKVFVNPDFPLEQSGQIAQPVANPSNAMTSYQPVPSETLSSNGQFAPNTIISVNPEAPILTAYPVHIAAACKVGAPCPHSIDSNIFCIHANRSKYYQCSPTGWIERECPAGLNFAGDHCDSVGSKSTLNIGLGLINKGTPHQPLLPPKNINFPQSPPPSLQQFPYTDGRLSGSKINQLGLESLQTQPYDTLKQLQIASSNTDAISRLALPVVQPAYEVFVTPQEQLQPAQVQTASPTQQSVKVSVEPQQIPQVAQVSQQVAQDQQATQLQQNSQQPLPSVQQSINSNTVTQQHLPPILPQQILQYQYPQVPIGQQPISQQLPQITGSQQQQTQQQIPPILPQQISQYQFPQVPIGQQPISQQLPQITAGQQQQTQQQIPSALSISQSQLPQNLIQQSLPQSVIREQQQAYQVNITTRPLLTYAPVLPPSLTKAVQQQLPQLLTPKEETLKYAVVAPPQTVQTGYLPQQPFPITTQQPLLPYPNGQLSQPPSVPQIYRPYTEQQLPYQQLEQQQSLQTITGQGQLPQPVMVAQVPSNLQQLQQTSQNQITSQTEPQLLQTVAAQQQIAQNQMIPQPHSQQQLPQPPVMQQIPQTQTSQTQQQFPQSLNLQPQIGIPQVPISSQWQQMLPQTSITQQVPQIQVPPQTQQQFPQPAVVQQQIPQVPISSQLQQQLSQFPVAPQVPQSQFPLSAQQQLPQPPITEQQQPFPQNQIVPLPHESQQVSQPSAVHQQISQPSSVPQQTTTPPQPTVGQSQNNFQWYYIAATPTTIPPLATTVSPTAANIVFIETTAAVQPVDSFKNINQNYKNLSEIYKPIEHGKCSLRAPPRGHVFSDQSDVRTFLMCIPPRNSWLKAEVTDGQWVRMRCPEGLVFNPNLKVCDKSLMLAANSLQN